MSLQEILICKNCGGSLRFSTTNIQCDICNITYDIILDIPLIVDNSEQFVSNYYFNLIEYIKSCEEYKEKLVKKLPLGLRLDSIKDHISILNLRINYYNSIKIILDKYVKSKNIKLTKLQTELNYIGCLNHIIRDWSNNEDSINERDKIIQLFKKAKGYLTNFDNILLPGTGSGMLAFYLCAFFSKVYAFDNSIGMLLTHHLLEKGIPISIFNFIKIHKDEPSRNNYILSQEIKPSNLFNFAGNIQNLPLKKSSISNIILNNAFDVVPVNSYLSNMYRVLKTKGKLMIFGPIHYHFDQIEFEFTPFEILQYIEEVGFKVLEYNIYEDCQLYSSFDKSNLLFKNLFLVCEK